MDTAGHHSGGSVAKAEGWERAGSEQDMVRVGPGGHHTPILSSPQRRETKAQK